jgi:hypothetical protein
MSSEIHSLIERLQDATEPDRDLDAAIAEAVDWSGLIGNVATLSDGLDRIPRFTSYPDHAVKLARAIDPDHVGALKWEDGDFYAVIDYQEPSKGNSPALALCIAALKHRLTLTE